MGWCHPFPAPSPTEPTASSANSSRYGSALTNPSGLRPRPTRGTWKPGCWRPTEVSFLSIHRRPLYRGAAASTEGLDNHLHTIPRRGRVCHSSTIWLSSSKATSTCGRSLQKWRRTYWLARGRAFFSRQQTPSSTGRSYLRVMFHYTATFCKLEFSPTVDFRWCATCLVMPTRI